VGIGRWQRSAEGRRWEMLIANQKLLKRPEAVPESVNVAGARVTPFESYEQALSCIEDSIKSRCKTFWVAINPQKCFRAWHEHALLNVLNQADVGICDGVGVSIAAKILHGQRIKRCTGCDLFFQILPAAAQKGWRVFMLGASKESNAGACENLQRRFPGLKIVGHQNGFFEDTGSVIERINTSEADLLFVAMGSPAQEYWIWKHREEIAAPFCMGVGGSFDVASGVIKRAPAIFRKTGTEWLFQLVTEPHKRLRRQTVYVPFMLRVIGARLAGSNGSTQWSLKAGPQ
jgi:N-acetylglucosaminyldiphosphoundecaprenol N-acetyl-beta-D-mannosaminyltransferase